MGYKTILIKAGTQLQLEEVTNQAKDEVASKEALQRVAQAEALKAKKNLKTQQDKNDWIARSTVFEFLYSILFRLLHSNLIFKEPKLQREGKGSSNRFGSLSSFFGK